MDGQQNGTTKAAGGCKRETEVIDLQSEHETDEATTTVTANVDTDESLINSAKEIYKVITQTEQKRHREKVRRNAITNALGKLGDVLFQINPNNELAQTPLNRVDILTHATLSLEKLYAENQERKLEIERLTQVMTAPPPEIKPPPPRVTGSYTSATPVDPAAHAIDSLINPVPYQQQLQIQRAQTPSQSSLPLISTAVPITDDQQSVSSNKMSALRYLGPSFWEQYQQAIQEEDLQKKREVEMKKKLREFLAPNNNLMEGDT